MSPGVAILLGVALVFGAMLAMQAWMGAKMRASEGLEAPDMGGLGDPEGRLVWFYGPNCGPCRAMHPAVDALGERVIQVDVSRHFEVARAFGVMATPTTILVRDGRIATVRPGALRPDDLEALLQG